MTSISKLLSNTSYSNEQEQKQEQKPYPLSFENIENRIVILEMECDKVIKNQNFIQKNWMVVYVCFEFYRLLISSLLLLFVPQNCNNAASACSMYDILSTDSKIMVAGLICNYTTLFTYLILYVFEIKRELALIKFLDVNVYKPFDNTSVEIELSKLPREKYVELFHYDYYYQKIGYVCGILFFANTLFSGILLYNRVLNNQSFIIFATNIMFMVTKIYHMYVIISSKSSIFYSAYLMLRVQYNDIDSGIRCTIENEIETASSQ